ncbi:MAG: GntP family permease [Gemmatimonadetes bacterium]|nr:GntP family permease [Gemmatimonadota bacterium]
MDLQLLAALVIGVGLIVGLILRTRLDAFLALLVAALATGLIAGVAPTDTVDMITTGFGNTLASIGIVIGLGVMIGKFLEVSGGADALAQVFLRVAGKGREEWAMAGTGAVVSIPVFCDSGYVIMHPLARSLARRSGRSFVAIALALGAGMTVTHHLVPPTPGPLAVAGILGVDLGRLTVVGLLISLPLIPVVVLYARWIGPRLDSSVAPEIREALHTDATPQTEVRIGATRAFLPLLIPLFLIVGNTMSRAFAPEARLQGLLGFVGAPVVALLIGVVLAIYTLTPAGTSRGEVSRWLHEAAGSAGFIILITGAGGALGNVLRQSGVGEALAGAATDMAVPAFIIPFLISTLVRLAQGSGTVAMITAASLTAPLLGNLQLDPVVAALGACVGSIFFSYYNDSYFWVVTRFTGLEGTAALKGWSGITTSLWAAGFGLLWIAHLILS